MPKLILSMDGLVLNEVVLEGERLTIGRHADNDIRIDSAAISRHHAVITCILGDAFIEDRDSTNGTYVNGRPIRRHALGPDDEIELGQYRLKYIDEREPALLRASRSGHTPFTAAAQPPGPHLSEASAPTVTGVIQVLSGASAGQRVVLEKSETTLGRGGREVLVVSRREREYYIRHVPGAGRPSINGMALGHEPRKLQHRDIIEMSGTRMAFMLGAGEAG